MTNTASSRARPAPTLFSIVMMSSITRIRTARRRSSRLSTWLYSDGPLVPSWVASALMVSESHPSRSKKVRAPSTMLSRLSLAGRATDFTAFPARGRPPADGACG
ncbi:Uncharacterised protein [Mycobacterium tuberculosis]|uniref:Uncharacterized protein n=1 Tax=Mycobacterium tuberculosis TaxID=1773 RepID=A0A654TME4_MYCTX|nr:Uncharacterised protein [Mycobacterium tuberculosis]CNT97739.1 Uncharacterised protein [Mycobacterium tuberculosis]COW66620.1 Uncharacterised protein [Mycobacterium tuberculosis]